MEEIGKNNLRDKNNAVEVFVDNLTSEIWLRLSARKSEFDFDDRMRESYNRKLLEEEGAERYLEIFMEEECSMLLKASQKTSNSEVQEFYLDLLHSVEKKIRNFIAEMKHDYEPVNYLHKKLDSILNAEFNNQILFVNGERDNGTIQLVEDEKKIFDVVVGKDGLEKRKNSFSMSLFDHKCIFMDDVYVLDDLIDKIENSEKEDANLRFLFDFG